VFGELQEELERSLSGLRERERLVLRGRFGLDDGHSKTQAELAKEIGRSSRTVRRIEKNALQKLRKPSP
jgi:RNA polymerase primary sigma factor